MYRAAAKLKQQFAWITVALVLQHRIGYRLARVVVLQLKACQWQAVDEQHQVQCPLRFITAVAHLASHAEDIGRKVRGRLVIARRRRTKIELQRCRPMLDALA